MLSKQTPASNIPRFNPHGYQPPPQERKKEEESPKKRLKKQVVEEEVVDFTQFNIEQLLLDLVSNLNILILLLEHSVPQSVESTRRLVAFGGI